MADEDLLVALNEGGSLPPLYCVHAISGSPFSYIGLARRLGPERPVLCVGAPGFENGRAPAAEVDGLARDYAAIVRERHGTGPVALLGWSFGGVVAHETAGRLQQDGVDVILLVLVDSMCAVPRTFPAEAEMLRSFTEQMLREAGCSSDALRSVLAGAPTAAEPDWFFKELTREDTLFADFQAAHLSQRYKVFRAHAQALCGHRSRRGYQGRALCLQAADSPVAAGTWSDVLKWTWVADVPGDHHSIWRGEGLDCVVAEVSARLAEGSR